MIAGKTYSEILAMTRGKRQYWYKKISTDEKEEVMRIIETARRAKQMGEKHWNYGKTHSEGTKAKISAAAKLRVGGKNGFFGKTHTDAAKAKMSEGHAGKTLTEEHKAKIGMASIELWKDPEFRDEQSARMTGDNNHNWQGGIATLPYGPEFNSTLKSQIRARDNHTCQECNQTEEQIGRALDVHHIDYDKKNNSPENLISLCRSCHVQTNFSREDWIEYFGRIMEVSE